MTETDRGIYTDIQPTDKLNSSGHLLYTARCKVCGTIVTERLYAINHKNLVCTHKQIKSNIKNKRIAKIFNGMKQRCYNNNEKAYKFYGAQGIKVCDEWLNDPSRFEKWSLENGYNDKLTIDRKDSTKDYCPENCRWIDSITNSKYKKSTTILFVDNIGLSLRDWSTFLGKTNSYLSKYLKTHNTKEASHMIKKYINKQGRKALIKLKQFSQYFIDLKDQYYTIEIKTPDNNTYITTELINNIVDDDQKLINKKGE